MAIVLFLAGLSRQLRPEDSVWKKVTALNLSWFILIPLVVSAPWWAIALVAIGTVVPTAGGVYLRRYIGGRAGADRSAAR